MEVKHSEYQGVAPRLGKLYISAGHYVPIYDHNVALDDFKALDMESDREIKKLFIKWERPLSNKNIFSQELFLFQLVPSCIVFHYVTLIP